MPHHRDHHIWVALLTLLAGCGSSHFNLATQRQEYTLTSTAREVEMGRALAQRIEQELPVVNDEPLQARVRRIGARLAAVCTRKELVYHFTVLADPTVNAFSLPGGYVFIHDGLIKKTASDDELAAVIAHEIAHVAARHAIKRYEGSVGLQLLQLATLAAGQPGVVQGVGIAARATQLSYARQEELEADRLGAGYMQAAGFAPRAMLTFLRTLQTMDQDERHELPRGVVRPHYGLTHPYIPERVRAVKEALFGVADYVDYLNTPE